MIARSSLERTRGRLRRSCFAERSFGLTVRDDQTTAVAFFVSARAGWAKIWHTGSMTTSSSAKPRLVPCHFTVDDLQLIEWSCREKAQRARKDAKSDATPSSIETFTSTATKYEALALRIQRLKELGTR